MVMAKKYTAFRSHVKYHFYVDQEFCYSTISLIRLEASHTKIRRDPCAEFDISNQYLAGRIKKVPQSASKKSDL